MRSARLAALASMVGLELADFMKLPAGGAPTVKRSPGKRQKRRRKLIRQFATRKRI